MSYIPSSPGDWPEDFAHENGQYMCGCLTCGYRFIGHKRRMTCKICHDIEVARRDALTPEEREVEDAKVREEVKAFFAKMALDKAAQGE